MQGGERHSDGTQAWLIEGVGCDMRVVCVMI